MKRIYLLVLLSILLFSFNHIKSNSKTTKYAGIYSFGDNIEKGPVGSVTVFPESDTSILFYVDICKGAPSYNLGQRYGRLKIENGKGIYYFKEDGDKKGCKWNVAISDNILTIKTLDDCYECGFGANVIADNSYDLINNKIPLSFVNGEGDTVYFAKTKPR